jgi:hypothetical protein
MLSVGPVPVAARRLDAHRLELEYEGGLLASPLSQLYRSARMPMSPGERVELRGLSIELTRVTEDGRPAAAVFTFAEPLESARYRFIAWKSDRYGAFAIPAVGATAHLEPARMPFELRLFD